MAAREILLYPHPILQQPDNEPATSNYPFLEAALRDLVDTLEASPGVALAAPQIGYSLRAIIVDVSRDRRPERRQGHGRIILLNPTIKETASWKVIREGCLSVPDFTGDVHRFQRVVVEGSTPDGRHLILESTGFEAVAFQHEIDHLAGKLFLDRLISPHRDLHRRRNI